MAAGCCGFVDQGGNELLNSKVTFRAVAAGTGLPIPEGIVTETPAEAVDFLWELLGSNRAAIAKQDTGSGGRGTPAGDDDGQCSRNTRPRRPLSGAKSRSLRNP